MSGVHVAFDQEALGERDWTPGPSQFSPTDTNGWEAVNVPLEVSDQCVGFGRVLGGRNTIAKGQIRRQYTGIDDEHEALFVLVRFIAVGGWFGDSATLAVEGVRQPATQIDNTGTADFVCSGQRSKEVPLFALIAHDSTSAQVAVEVDLNGPASQESFAIASALVRPLVGVEVGAAWKFVPAPNQGDFSDDTNGWLALDGARVVCGDRGTLLTSRGTFGSAMVRRLHEGLPEHNAMNLKVDITVPWALDDTVRVHLFVDGRQVWRGEFRTTQTTGCASGETAPSQSVDLLVMDHVSDRATIAILAQGAVVDEPTSPMLGISSFALTPLQLGSAAWKEGQQTFSEGVAGWFVPVVDSNPFSACTQPKTLGGHGLTSKETFRRIFSGLPTHGSVILSLGIAIVGSWDRERLIINVDGVTVYNQAFTWQVHTVSSKDATNIGCSRWGQTNVQITILIEDHVSPALEATFRTTLNENSFNEAVGLYNYEVVPLPASPRILQASGAGEGEWRSGATAFGGDIGTDGWLGIELSVADACGRSALVSKGYNGFGAWANKTFTRVPQSKEVELSFTLDVTHMSGLGTVTVFVDGKAIHRHQYVAPGTTSCVDFVQGKRRAYVKAAFVATQPSFTISVGFSGGFRNYDSSLGVFAISEFALRADAIGRAPWQPGPSNFTRGLDGWFFSAATAATTTCDDGVVMLGGHGVVSQGFARKTFTQLPPHDALIIRIELVFVHTWDNEVMQLLADGVQVYQRRYRHRSTIAEQLVQCDGVNSMTDPVLLTLDGHTADEVTITVKTTLNSHAFDESFGIKSVVVTPINDPPIEPNGVGSSPWRLGPARFGRGFDPLDGFAGAGLSIITCDPAKNSILGVEGQHGLLADVQKEFTDLPEHFAVSVSAVVHPTTNQLASSDARARVEVRLDNVVVFYAIVRINTSPSAESACGEAVSVDVRGVIAHVASSVRVAVRVGLINAEANQRGVMAISKLEVTPQVEAVAPWAAETADTFDAGLDGWKMTGVLSGLVLTVCDETPVLGGYDVAGKGAAASKTFTRLPDHERLLVTFKFYFVHSWDGEVARLTVDGEEVWSRRFSRSQLRNRVTCVLPAHVEDVEVVISHSLAAASLAFSTTINEAASNEAWAISDVKLTPLSLAATSLDGLGYGAWQPGRSLFRDGNLDGWQGVSVKGRSCESPELASGILVSAGTRGLLNTVSKTVTNLPRHTSLTVEIEVIPYHRAGEHTLTVMLDDVAITSDPIFHEGPITSCDGSAIFFVRHAMTHRSDNLTIRVSSSAGLGAASSSLGVFGVANVVVSYTDRTGTDAVWKEDLVSDFSKGRDGWFVSPSPKQELQEQLTSSCGSHGPALGGFGVFGYKGYAERTFTSLPSHSSILVMLNLFYILTWDNEYAEVFVDGKSAFKQYKSWAEISQTQDRSCSLRHTVKEARGAVVAHTADNVTVRVAWNLNEVRPGSRSLPDVRPGSPVLTCLPQPSLPLAHIETTPPATGTHKRGVCVQPSTSHTRRRSHGEDRCR